MALALVAAIGACDDGGSGPRPSDRFAGLWTLEQVSGEPLPHDVITPSERLQRRAVTLEVSAAKYLPEALWTDSLVRVEQQPGGGTIETNRTVRMTLMGFVSGDTIRFRVAPGSGDVFRFVLEDPARPVLLLIDGSPADQVWSRR